MALSGRWSLLLAAVASTASTGCGASEASGSPMPGGGALKTWASQALASAPKYMGSLDDGAACGTSYSTTGFEPVDPSGAKHPLFLYFVGTIFIPGDVSATYTSAAAAAVTEAMARRGFVALSAQYDNGVTAWLSNHEAQLDCLFGSGNASNLLAAACSLPHVDCGLGIATWGHSQGALVADLAITREPRVRAAWTTGYGGDPRSTLPRDRFRVVNGEHDLGTNGQVAGMNPTAGFTAAECPDDGRNECLRADGSGWIRVVQADCQTSSADHCWFDKKSCSDGPETLEPNWVDKASTKAFALEKNADWLAAATLRP